MARPWMDLIPDAVVSLTRLPRQHVSATIRFLKERGHISTGRPYAPPLNDREIARIVLALAAPARRHIPAILLAARITTPTGQTGEDLIARIGAGETAADCTLAISESGVELIADNWRPADCRSIFLVSAETVYAISNKIKEIQNVR